MPKISILASKMDYFFAVFGYQNRPLEAPWAHQGVQTESHLQNCSKVTKVMKTVYQKWFKKITQVMKKCFKNDFKSIPKRWKNIKQQVI